MTALMDRLRVTGRRPYGWRAFLDDLKSGLASLLVNIPLAMGIGLASGMGVPAAFHSAVIVGIVSALLGGTRAMKSGPSITLAVIVASLLSSGKADILQMGAVIMMAGTLQVAFGVLGLGRLMAYVPHVVLAGFMSGIGCFLVWSQSWRLVEMGGADMAVAGVCLATILFWPRPLRRVLPAPFAGLLAAWIVSVPWSPDMDVLRLGLLPLIGLPEMSIPPVSVEFLAGAIAPAFFIAVVGSAHTLAVALAADAVTGGRHNADRELVATGVANLMAGAFGAVPGSGNFSSMGMLRMGARTVVAGVVVALGIAGLMLGAGPLVQTLPVAAVLAVVIWMGWVLVDWRLLRRAHRIERRYGAAFLVTVVVAAAGEPITAAVLGFISITIGNAAALERREADSVLSVPLLDSMFLLPRQDSTDPYSARVGLISFRGPFTVASARKLAGLLDQDLRGHEAVIFDLSLVTYMDDSAAHLLKLLLGKARTMRQHVMVVGIQEAIRGSIDAFDALSDVSDGHVLDTMEEALRLADDLLANAESL